jgi:hypothetical protein
LESIRDEGNVVLLYISVGKILEFVATRTMLMLMLTMLFQQIFSVAYPKLIFITCNFFITHARGSVVVKTVCFKPEGHGPWGLFRL